MKQINLLKPLVKCVYLLFICLLTACGGEESTNPVTTQPPLTVVTASSTWKLLDSSHGTHGNAWQLEQCDACHLISDIHQSQAQIKGMVQGKGYQTCVGCHGNNGTQLQRTCLICHNTNDLPKTPASTGIQSHNFNPNQIEQFSLNQLTDSNCLDCHIASDMNGKFDINIDLTRFKDAQNKQSVYQDSSDFCLRCHNSKHQQQGFEIENKDYQYPLIAMRTNYEAIDFHGEINGSGQRTYSGLRAGYQYQEKLACTDCHAMHGSHNEKLIIGNSAIGASQIASSNFNGASINITTQDGDSSQLCVVCHQMKSIIDDGDQDTGNGLSGVHLTGQECRSCHQHGMAVQTGL